MNGRIVDTNILIYLSKKELDIEKVASIGVNLSISVITYMEVLGYRFTNKSEKKMVERLCHLFPVIGLSQEIVDLVISIRQYHRIKLPDAIILATAVVTEQDLVTANVNDFINIEPTLRIINPMLP